MLAAVTRLLLEGAAPYVPILVGTTAVELPVVLPPQVGPIFMLRPDAAAAHAAPRQCSSPAEADARVEAMRPDPQ
jgi:hypothetical protein